MQIVGQRHQLAIGNRHEGEKVPEINNALLENISLELCLQSARKLDLLDLQAQKYRYRENLSGKKAKHFVNLHS